MKINHFEDKGNIVIWHKVRQHERNMTVGEIQQNQAFQILKNYSFKCDIKRFLNPHSFFESDTKV